LSLNTWVCSVAAGRPERGRLPAQWPPGDAARAERDRAATDLGILVTHAPTESNWGGVAEGTITAMLTMLKKVRERDRYLKDGNPWRDPGLQGTYVGARADGYAGITLGLIGLGRIGSRVATLMQPWNVKILAYDPYVPDTKFIEHGVQRVDLDTLLRESDVVSLHVVLTRETRQIIGAAQLRLMKPTAILINTSRGFCVDESALVEALQQERIAGAALDVFEYEPLALNSPLRSLGDKVLLSPHMVSSNLGSGLRPGVRWATESVLHALGGEVPDNVYNTEVIPRWQRCVGGQRVWGVRPDAVPPSARSTKMKETSWHSSGYASAWWARMVGRTAGAPAPTSRPSPRCQKPSSWRCARRTRRPPRGRSNAPGLGWRSGTIGR
jgi:D-3-phosphoglycerate dehydrogenase / 2-oxoglutarate reductase